MDRMAQSTASSAKPVAVRPRTRSVSESMSSMIRGHPTMPSLTILEAAMARLDHEPLTLAADASFSNILNLIINLLSFLIILLDKKENLAVCEIF